MNKICPFLVVREHCLKEFCVFWRDVDGACSILVAISKYLNEVKVSPEIKVEATQDPDPEVIERLLTEAMNRHFDKITKGGTEGQ